MQREAEQVRDGDRNGGDPELKGGRGGTWRTRDREAMDPGFRGIRSEQVRDGDRNDDDPELRREGAGEMRIGKEGYGKGGRWEREAEGAHGPGNGWDAPGPRSGVVQNPATALQGSPWPGQAHGFSPPRDEPPMAIPYLPPPGGIVNYPVYPYQYDVRAIPTYYPTYGQRDDRDLVRRLSVLGLTLFHVLLLLNFIGLVFAIMYVPGRIMNLSELRLLFLSPLPPFLLVMGFDVGGTGMVLFFLFLVVSIFASFEIMLLRDGRSFLNLSRKLLDNQHLIASERREFDNNGFVLLGEFFMALMFFNVCFFILLNLLGREMQTPDFDEWETWELMYALAKASVWEEVVSRILLIGVPLFTLYLATGMDHSEVPGGVSDPGRGADPGRRSGPERLSGSRRRNGITGLNHLLGGNLRITPLTGGLILFSSILFGLAHMGAWDAYKVIPTTVGGFILGYLFLKKGVHVCIMLHFAINYLDVLPGALKEELALAVQFFIALLLIVMFSMGGYMFYKYMKRLLSHTYRMFTGRPFRFTNDGDTEFGGGEEW